VLSLVDNAIDAMSGVADRERLLHIDLRVERGETLALSVRDSGSGIAEEDSDRVFDAFHTTKPEAIGMGLAISRSLAEAHGGRLWLTPNQGHGVTFHLSLPIGEEEPPPLM
jgi:signal transduction histidine kinase